MASKYGPLKFGGARDDGKIFWGYSKFRKNNIRPMWYSPDAFRKKITQRKARGEIYRKSPAGRNKLHSRYLKVNYGITPEQYLDILKSQGGKCAICGNPETVKIFKRLAIDHCHTTGKIRGLLCNRCNTCIGKFEESIELMRAAIAYLEANRPTALSSL